MKQLHPEFLTHDGNPMFAVLPYEEYEYIVSCLEQLDRIISGAGKADSDADKAISLEQARELLEHEY